MNDDLSELQRFEKGLSKHGLKYIPALNFQYADKPCNGLRQGGERAREREGEQARSNRNVLVSDRNVLRSSKLRNYIHHVVFVFLVG